MEEITEKDLEEIDLFTSDNVVEDYEFTDEMMQEILRGDEQVKKTNTIIELRKLLLNYDLTLVYAKGKIDYFSAKKEQELSLEQTRTTKGRIYRYNNYVNRYARLYQQIFTKRMQLVKLVTLVLGRYRKPKQLVLYKHHILQMKKERIAEQLNMSVSEVEKIIKTFDNDLIEFAS